MSSADPERLVDRLGEPLGVAGNLVQVPRLVPPYPSRGRRQRWR
ncbi:hypothetical protein ACPA9J_10850 [Pseudomonas aeruginosa]